MPYLFGKIVHLGRKTEGIKTMENQNMNQNANPAANQETGEKTFTQEQVNAIVSRRLAEEKAKSEAALNKRETELNQREMQIKAKELLAEKGLPKNLADVLRYSDEESLKAAIDVIDKTRGFKDSSENTEQGEPKRKVFENPLPVPRENIRIDDPLRKAMGLN